MRAGAFRQRIGVFVSQSMAPEARARVLADTARRGRDDLIRSGRAAPAYILTVDGQEGPDEAQVKPDGRIVYRFNPLAEAAVFAMAYLRGRSPVRGGTFRDGWFYALSATGYTRGSARGTWHNGVKVAASYNANDQIISQRSFDPQKVGADIGEILISNRVPYERKVDVQLAGNRRLRFNVPADMINDCAQAVRQRWPTVDARRIYQLHHPGQYKLRTGKRMGSPVENPALVITVRA